MKAGELLEYYRQMLLIREFERAVLSFFEAKECTKIFGTTHLYIGQEAVAVGACACLDKDDYITSTHRGHGHFLAKGGDPRRIMAELFGRRTGYSKGRGGTQHMGDIRIGHLGSNGITGGGIPIATGAAFSIKYRGTTQVVVCFFGDGAVNEGVFHESLNMAALWNLPVIYVCENNLYAMSTPVSAAFPVKDIAERARAYNMPGVVSDGMDVLDVKEKVGAAVQRAREGRGPSLVECKTYRFVGHSKSDRCLYRTREEEAQWRRRDPIHLLKQRLIEHELCTPEACSAVERHVKEAVEDAVRYADESPWPSAEDLYGDLFAG
jgi:pyruvate dehydrogenase E1 component alpha subunit